MTVAPAVVDFAALNVVPLSRHFDAAEVYVRACHPDCELTYGQVQELAHRLASRPEWQAAVDAGRGDAVRGLDLLRERVAALVKRAEHLDPTKAEWVAVFLSDLRLTLGSSGDPGTAPTLNDFA